MDFYLKYCYDRNEAIEYLKRNLTNYEITTDMLFCRLPHNSTLLHHLATIDDVVTIRIIIDFYEKRNEPVKLLTIHNYSPFTYSISNNSISSFRLFLERIPNILEMERTKGMTELLTVAIKHRRIEMLRDILEHNKIVNVFLPSDLERGLYYALFQINSINDPMHSAEKMIANRAIKMLYEYGMCPRKDLNNGFTSLALAMEMDRKNVILFLEYEKPSVCNVMMFKINNIRNSIYSSTLFRLSTFSHRNFKEIAKYVVQNKINHFGSFYGVPNDDCGCKMVTMCIIDEIENFKDESLVYAIALLEIFMEDCKKKCEYSRSAKNEIALCLEYQNLLKKSSLRKNTINTLRNFGVLIHPNRIHEYEDLTLYELIFTRLKLERCKNSLYTSSR